MSKQKKHEGVNSFQQDVNRLSIETIHKLHSASYYAMKEVQGDRAISDTVLQSELYGDLWKASCIGHDRTIKIWKKEMQYKDMKLHDLLRELYQRMQMFYHYAECKGRELPGIKCHTEGNGVFAINLRECVMNMEHSFTDPDAANHDRQREGRLFCIGLNLPLLETEDPENPESHLADEYDEFLNFCCEFEEDHECRDIYPCEYSHELAIKSILAHLDVISEMTVKD